MRAKTSDKVAEILDGLKHLNLVNKAALDTLKNMKDGGHRDIKEDGAKVDSLKRQKNKLEGSSEDSVIVISSDSNADNLMPMQSNLSKATLLNMLTKRASDATDNATLAVLVKEFVDVMKMNSSRTLTKDAFRFLDVLFKQLEDPSVFIIQKRLELRVVKRLFTLITE